LLAIGNGGEEELARESGNGPIVPSHNVGGGRPSGEYNYNEGKKNLLNDANEDEFWYDGDDKGKSQNF
jgi:hypothetical protein